MKTRTGGFSLGFRRVGSAWQKDLNATIEWAKGNDLEVIDLRKDGDQSVKRVIDAGLRIGSVDLPEWEGMISPDPGRRADAIDRNAAYVEACAVVGPINHFLVMLPEDPARERAENFGYMVEGFGELVPVLEKNGARVVVEGWPGPGALCCTPEVLRAFFKVLPTEALGLNYDPSHLIRQSIDPLRFLHEFGDRVYHVHGKDAELLTDKLYEFGHEQPPTFAKSIPWGAVTWRYALPGHGVMRWNEAFRILESIGYSGCVSIELEDAHFNGTTEGEKLGILQGARFLSSC